MLHCPGFATPYPAPYEQLRRADAMNASTGIGLGEH